jgi:hypothetical protein
MIVNANSGITSPQLELRETELDYARLNFSTVGTPEGEPAHFGFWSIAARTRPASEGGPAADQSNFFNNRSGDAMTLYGNGWMGLGPAAFTPDAPLMVTSNGFYAPGIGPFGRGDFHIGNSALGLSFGVATGGGGVGAARIWTDGGLVNQLFLGSAAHGDVLAIKDGSVGIGHTNPAATLDVDGTARVRALADAGATVNRAVQVEPDGDLVVAGSTPTWIALASSAFRTHLGDTSPDSGGLLLAAPVVLPHGSRVTALRLTMVDASAGDFLAGLVRLEQGSTNSTSNVTAVTSGASTGIRTFDSAPGLEVIDNQTAAYEVWILPPTGGWDPTSNVRSVRLQVE